MHGQPEAAVPALQGAGQPRYVEVKRAVSTWGLMYRESGPRQGDRQRTGGMMPEGLSPTEVGREIQGHRKEALAEEAHSDEDQGSARVFTIIEAVMLAVVAVFAAWSGFASAKWGTESSLDLARASAARTEANRAQLTELSQKNFDSSTFDAWFTAYTLNNQTAMKIAVRRFSPQFLKAFNSWLATDPETNPNAPKGPTYMPDYVQPGLALANHLDKQADNYYALGDMAASRF